MEPNSAIRVVVTDRDARVSQQLAQLLAQELDLDIVATAVSAAEVEAVVAEHRPDVVILDPRLQEDGTDLEAGLRTASPHTAYLMHVTGADEREQRRDNGDRRDVVLKTLRTDRLITAIRRLGAESPSPGDADQPGSERKAEQR